MNSSPPGSCGPIWRAASTDCGWMKAGKSSRPRRCDWVRTGRCSCGTRASNGSSPSPMRALFSLAVCAAALVAGIAEIRLLVVGVEDRIGGVHRAPCVEAVAQTEDVPELVNRLLQRPLEEHVLVARLAVELRTQPMNRDDGATLGFIGAAEDELMRGFVKVVVGDRQDHPLLDGVGLRDAVQNRAQKELLADAVERALGDGQTRAHDRREQKPFLEAGRQAGQKRRVDRIDGDDTDLTHAIAFRGDRVALLGGVSLHGEWLS